MIGRKELEQYNCVKTLDDYSHVRNRLEEFNASPSRHTLLTCQDEGFIQTVVKEILGFNVEICEDVDSGFIDCSYGNLEFTLFFKDEAGQPLRELEIDKDDLNIHVKGKERGILEINEEYLEHGGKKYLSDSWGVIKTVERFEQPVRELFHQGLDFFMIRPERIPEKEIYRARIQAPAITKKKRQKRLFVDLDGTLYQFVPGTPFEDLLQGHYFANLTPQQNVIDAVRMICQTRSDIEVCTLGSYPSDTKDPLWDKNERLNEDLPEIEWERRVFLPLTYTKAYAFDKLTKNDYLLDDYTKNLKEWEAQGGTGIKLLTDINHTRETWNGSTVRFDMQPQELMEDILSIISQGKTLIQNYKPARRKSM